LCYLDSEIQLDHNYSFIDPWWFMANQSDLNLTTELRLRAKSGDETHVQDLPVSVMQALYHEITGRTETLERRFDGDYIFDHEEVSQLVQKFLQAIQQYNITGTDAQFTIKYVGGEKQTFSSLEKFLQLDSSKAEKVFSCEFIISFLLATPGLAKYQNYRIKILLRSWWLQADKKNLNWGISGNDVSAVLGIEYVDYVVSQVLISVFENWLSSLRRQEIKRTPKTIEKLDEFFQLGFSAVTCCATLLLSFGLFAIGVFGTPHDNIRILGAVYISLSLAMLLGSFSYGLAQSILYRMWPHGKFPYIVFNKGDERNFKLSVERRSSEYKFWRNLAIGAVGAILSSLIGGLVTTIIGLGK